MSSWETNTPESIPRPVQRRAFQARRRGMRRPERQGNWPPPSWRARVPPAMVRAFVATGFLASPALESRIGGAAVAVTCVLMAICAILGAGAIYRSEAEMSWCLSATDAATVLIIAPVAMVLGSIAVADPQIGGAGTNVTAGMLAVLGAVVICSVVALITAAWTTPQRSALAILPATLVVVAVALGAEHFGTHRAMQGIAGALMISALATLIDGLVEERHRVLIPPITFALFAILVIAGGQASAGSMTADNAIVTFLGTALAGCTLIILPGMSMRLQSQMFSPPTDQPPASDGWSGPRH